MQSWPEPQNAIALHNQKITHIKKDLYDKVSFSE